MSAKILKLLVQKRRHNIQNHAALKCDMMLPAVLNHSVCYEVHYDLYNILLHMLISYMLQWMRSAALNVFHFNMNSKLCDVEK